VFLDSALVVESGGRVLLNANDCKLMGAPLRQLLRRHPRIDFVLRSHSSANSRACFEVIGKPDAAVDDRGRYVRDFASFVRATGATWAIPFASNHCHLHDDVLRFNEFVTTPLDVQEHFEAHGVESPRLQVMVSGDSWSEQEGFRIAPGDWFEAREQHLEQYRLRKKRQLDEQRIREAGTRIKKAHLERYFAKAIPAMPRPLRRLFRGTPVLYVLTAGEQRFLFEVDLHRGEVREVDRYTDATHPLQIHTSAAILRHCMRSDLFSHLAISKRVRYRVSPDKKRLMVLLNLFFNCYEYEMLPVRRLLSRRFVTAWAPRWRELGLYARIATRLALGRGFDMARELPAPPASVVEPAARVSAA
jgi:UDP-MurNAc hydroxylase